MFKSASATIAFSLMASTAMAQTSISWWHGMGGRNGEVINEISQQFNAAQDASELVAKLRAIHSASQQDASKAGLKYRDQCKLAKHISSYEAGAHYEVIT